MTLVTVRPCTASAFAVLRVAWPPAGVHESHFARHLSGDATYLIARIRDIPVGSCVVRWTGPVGDKTVQVHPDLAEVVHAQVQADYRGQGVGGALIDAAEQAVRESGSRQVGVSADQDNFGARRLYTRLGYEATGIHDVSHYDWVSDSGKTHHATEHNELFLKTLLPRGWGGDSAKD